MMVRITSYYQVAEVTTVYCWFILLGGSTQCLRGYNNTTEPPSATCSPPIVDC